MNNDDSSENQNRQGVSLSTIQEFQVISNSYTAEFGRSAGAVVLVQTKSGTNAVHGDLYECISEQSAQREGVLLIAARPRPIGRGISTAGRSASRFSRDRLFAFLSARSHQARRRIAVHARPVPGLGACRAAV